MSREIDFTVKYEPSYLYAICSDVACIHNMPKMIGPLVVTVYAQCNSDGPYGEFHVEPVEIVPAIDLACEPSSGSDAKACRVMFVGVVAGYISNLCATGNEKIEEAAQLAWNEYLAAIKLR